MTHSPNVSALPRRDFLSRALIAASALGAGVGYGDEPKPADPKPIEYKRKIKWGLLGCGGRGNWLAGLFKAHGGYELYAVADYFKDAADATAKAHGVDESRRFTGLSGYKKMLECGIEAMMIIDVPYFYPQQATDAVAAGIHVYVAKPVAVDVPGTLMIGAAGKEATKKQRVFLVDYQLPLEPVCIEIADRIRAGALEKMYHITSFGLAWQAWPDPVIGENIESRLRGEIWLSDTNLSGDTIVSYDIHIIDGITWIMGKPPKSACGMSRTCRPDPHGDRTDVMTAVYEYDDGVMWSHVTQSLSNGFDIAFPTLSANFFGPKVTAHLQYGGKNVVRGGPKNFAGNCGSIYDDGAKRNIASFYTNVTEGKFENANVQRAVDGHLACILGREAANRRCFLTMETLLKENKRLEVDLKGLKA
ncbi:MAG TPA: hypothetical protein VGP72_27265 [Planctomycetota bacterium]|jgi:predicted dehydrogenase